MVLKVGGAVDLNVGDEVITTAFVGLVVGDEVITTEVVGLTVGLQSTVGVEVAVIVGGVVGVIATFVGFVVD